MTTRTQGDEIRAQVQALHDAAVAAAQAARQGSACGRAHTEAWAYQRVLNLIDKEGLT
jgi:hypothetical protein